MRETIEFEDPVTGWSAISALMRKYPNDEKMAEHISTINQQKIQSYLERQKKRGIRRLTTTTCIEDIMAEALLPPRDGKDHPLYRKDSIKKEDAYIRDLKHELKLL